MSTSAIDLEGMGALISRLGNASTALHDVSTDLRGRASARGVSTTATWRMGNVAQWIDRELPGLRRRLDMARAIDAARPVSMRGGTVRLSEPVLSAHEARRVGREIADGLPEGGEPEEIAAALHDVAEELRPYLDDPEVMSAFWDRAGQDWVDGLPSHLVASASETAAQDFQVYSRSFVTAVHDTTPPPGLETMIDTMGRAPESPDVAWSRLALLQHGTAPTEILEAVTRANAVDIVHSDVGHWDFRGSMFAARELGLPEDALALAFDALAGDPVAARNVISSGPGTQETVDLIYGYARSFGTGDEVVDAFGRALETGAGVHDEEMGAHTYAARRFAFDVIVATAGHDDVPWMVKDSLGEIAASYAPELLAGASLADAPHRDSAMTRPDNWSRIVGLNPGFYLSVDDTYAFLRSFGDSDELAAPFDEAAGALYEDLITQAMVHDETNGTHSVLDTSYMFGNLAGAQFLAQREVRGRADDFDQAVRDVLAKVFTFGVGKIPTPQGQLAGYAWKATVWGIGKGVDSWKQGDPEQTRVALLEDATLQAAFLRDYELTRLLLDASPERAQTLPPELTAPGGGLIDAVDIAEDADLIETYQNWIDSQDQDGVEGTTDKIIDRSGGMFSGGFNDLRNRFGDI